jgi:dihydrofolate synthase/folylpolyglutamate synthase
MGQFPQFLLRIPLAPLLSLVLLPRMNYQQTLDFLFTRLPMFSRIGASAIKKDLTNTVAICEALGNPYRQFKSVHIAGTNGKGSTSHMLAAILQTAGYKTGLYTSPHLHDFRERIRINGAKIPEQYVIDFTERVLPLIDKIEPSFFEITVAMAFSYFAEEKVDIAVIEVGLGGRLDSTNVITPELSVITNIGYDHMNLLGNTLPEIAGEKAGIIKNNIPVVIGETHPETKPVFDAKAKEKAAKIIYASKDYYISEWSYEKTHLDIHVAKHGSIETERYQLDLPGYYQTKNLLTVLESVKQLQQLGWNISRQHVGTALSQTKKLTGLHGRWELIHQHPDIILDVAHNEDGMRQVMAQLEIASYHHLHIVLGMVKDKEISKVLQLLPNKASYYFTRAQIPRALPENTLAEMAAGFGLKGSTYPNVKAAIHAARSHANDDDLILVCGSVFLVGEVERS